jgi:AraC-like DNA-binding protein
MKLPHWNESLARLLKSRLVYAVDSQQLNQTSLHCQPGLELNFTCAGRGTLHVGDKTFALAAGTLVLIPEPVPHRLEVHTKGRYVRSVLCIAPPARDSNPSAGVLRPLMRKLPFREPCCLYLDESSARMVRTLMARIAAETAKQAVWWQDTVLALACELMVFSARLSNRLRLARPPGSRLPDETAAHVALHLEEDLTLKAVATHFGVSREHLSRAFHRHFGITYQRHVLNKRLDSARQLLMNPEGLSLLEIALASGFQSHSSFSRVFRKHVGVTPGQFRKLHLIGS